MSGFETVLLDLYLVDTAPICINWALFSDMNYNYSCNFVRNFPTMHNWEYFVIYFIAFIVWPLQTVQTQVAHITESNQTKSEYPLDIRCNTKNTQLKKNRGFITAESKTDLVKFFSHMYFLGINYLQNGQKYVKVPIVYFIHMVLVHFWLKKTTKKIILT